jgi:actin
MNYFENDAVVIDLGTGCCRAGFAGDDEPRVIIPLVLGSSKYPIATNAVACNKTTYVGYEAIERKGILRLREPIEHGIVTDWVDMEYLWEIMFDQLRILPNERAVLITESPLNPTENREKMAEIMFEKFGVPSLYVAVQAVLSMYSHNVLNGISFYSGEGTTHICAIYEGFILSNLTRRMDLAGSQLTDYLRVLMLQKNVNFSQACTAHLNKKTPIPHPENQILFCL